MENLVAISLDTQFRAAVKASRSLPLLEEKVINHVLHEVADAAEREEGYILAENHQDLALMDRNDPKYDRLQLTSSRIEAIAADIRNVATLNYPVGEILEERTLPNGLHLSKITVPLGVVGVIYEARPNVTLDVFALCLKSGNVCLLKGGSDAAYSNSAIVSVIRDVLKKNGLDENIIQMLPSDRAATDALLKAVGFVDIIIPRGSQGLIDFVRNNAKVPVIETGAGIVHTYFDETGDLKKGTDIICNAKTRRVSVCNALDCLIVHRSRLAELPKLVAPLTKTNVLLYVDTPACEQLKGHYPSDLLRTAKAEHYGTEFLSYKMAIKTVDSLPEALEHIATYGSKHSEAIVSENETHIDYFLKSVDAAVVYANTSTAFTDGAQFGLGAEIGISTQKLHARGPMALRELTSYKWIVRGNGHIRR